MIKLLLVVFFSFSIIVKAQDIYEGVGYQKDINESWKIRIEVNSYEEYSITYATIPCKAKWTKVYANGNKIYFKEKIFEGQDLCNDNGIVLLKKESDETYLFY